LAASEYSLIIFDVTECKLTIWHTVQAE